MKREEREKEMIVNDNWIKNQCVTPTHVLEKISYLNEKEIGKFVEWLSMDIPTDKFLAWSYGLTFNSNSQRVRPVTDEELANWKPMISPFVASSVKTDSEGKKILSYGLTSSGYDVSLSNKFKIFTPKEGIDVIDPLNFDEGCLVDVEGDSCIIPPHGYMLGVTNEWFEMPDNVTGLCIGKSTLARCGAHCNTTPLIPGFRGNVVIEISNSTPLPLKVYANQGIAQILFFQSADLSEHPYSGGKYDGQSGITLAKA